MQKCRRLRGTSSTKSRENHWVQTEVTAVSVSKHNDINIYHYLLATDDLSDLSDLSVKKLLHL